MRKLTLAAVALLCLGAGYGVAQTEKQDAPRPLQIEMGTPVGLTDDLALRVERMHDGRVIGTLMAKVDGRWVEVHLASANMRAEH